ncbi:MAG TPA: hypothetical protein VGB50_06305 [Flavobacterium sp.]|jgi:hypothetical protein
MTPKEFSRQISSYIDYNTLIYAITELKVNPDRALEKSVLFLGSEHLLNARDWNLYTLFSEFLKDFKIPESSLDLIVELEDVALVSAELSNLKKYNFTGELRGNPSLQHIPSNLHYKPIIAIYAESFILDILYYPANFLMNAIEVLSITWQKAKNANMSAFFEPSSPSELFAYIEYKIASSYELLNKANPGKNAGNSTFFGYRYVNITHELPINPILFSFVRDAAHRQAKGTI